MPPKAKKILIGGPLALALLGWRGYDAVKTVKLKEFVEHYNVFINNENRFSPISMSVPISVVCPKP